MGEIAFRPTQPAANARGWETVFDFDIVLPKARSVALNKKQ